MKRIGNLFNKICTIENFRLAYKRATKGKKNYKEVQQIEKFGVEQFLENLLEEVKTHKYKTSKYKVFNLKTGGKWREIYKLPMRDRIVQHALMNYMELIFRKSFITDTYSSIKERGLHKCLHRLQKALKDVENTKYCLKLDIKKFYPSINQELMKQAIRRKFKDKDLLMILDEIIDSTDKGVPIGNYTSQYFANFFLTPMDHWIKEQLKIKHYFRYCDDMIILGSNKQDLHNLQKLIQNYLLEIKLTLKSNYQVFPIDIRGIDFVGYVTKHSHTLVRKRTKHNFIKNRCHNNIYSYWGIFCHGNCLNLWNKYKLC